MRHLEVLAPHEEPIIVLMAPRLRCGREDHDALEYFIADFKRPVIFRVSGMVAGPERYVEFIAPAWGHVVEVWGDDGVTPAGRVQRLTKNDNAERDAASLIGAHALWVWTLEHQVGPDSKLVDYEMITIAQDMGIPVFLFLPQTMNFEVLEL